MAMGLLISWDLVAGSLDLRYRLPDYYPVELGASVWIWLSLFGLLDIVHDACGHQVGIAK